MIGVNILRTKVLITTDEVFFHAPMDHNCDARVVLQCIILAERRLVKPALGFGVYKALIDAKNTLVTAGNLATLQTDVNAGRGSDRQPIILKEGDYVNSDNYLNADQKTLWNDYLHKVVAECVWLVALPVNRARFTSEGVMKNAPETLDQNRDSVTVDLKDLQHLLDKGLNERVSVLIQDMHEYLCHVKFAGYTGDCGCGCKGEGNAETHSGAKTSGLILGGLYDDDSDTYKRNRNRNGWY